MAGVLKSIVVLVLAFSCVLGQASQSVIIPGDSETWGAVHMHCGEGQPQMLGTEIKGPAGPPGKSGREGSKGDSGEVGPKGEKGSQGDAGPQVDVAQFATNMLKGYTSCGELNARLGITEAGHYILRNKDSADPIYAYCDFTFREGVAECGDLVTKHNLTETGFYRMTSDADTYFYCNFTSRYEDASSCSDLKSRHSISENGFYIMMSDTNELIYAYCDFKEYSGVKNCGQLASTHGITQSGYYLMTLPTSSSASYVHCNFKTFQGVSTCHQLKNRHNVSETGFYSIQPDQDEEVFELFCKFSADEAITEIWHDMMDEIQVLKKCGTKGCYTRSPIYTLSWAGITKIVLNSSECKQFIRFRCRGTYFLNAGHAWWVSRDGENMTYWGGATSRRDKYCACGEAGNCINNAYKCNCDINGDPPTQDEGYLTDKTKLPVKELAFGDQNDSTEYAYHSLGKLECTG